MAENKSRGTLQTLDQSKTHIFEIPSKRINESDDLNFWLTTWAYTDIMIFLLQLNAAMFPRRTQSSFQAWNLHDDAVHLSKPVQKLRDLVRKLEDILGEAPPDPGPRRFGNVSFRKWYQIVQERLDGLLEEHLPSEVLTWPCEDGISAKDEIKSYLLGSFGSAQRLDYGTGHELSFIAFLGCIWKLGGFQTSHTSWGTEERGIVIGVIEPYLGLVRKLILTYTLEPAGSHGVWGLDDHSFVSYIFGSAQFSPPISTPADISQEGSIPDAPHPGDVTKDTVVSRERETNMYFAAIGFIYDVKKGPFWEHSPILFDISGVTAGWAKINKGMIKMYNAEVLSKFPVVQHFPFGSLFRWERNPNVIAPIVPTHASSQTSRTTNMQPSSVPSSMRPSPGASGTAAPWASVPMHRTNAMPGPGTSWTGQSGATGLPATRAPWAMGSPRNLPNSSSAAAPVTTAPRTRGAKLAGGGTESGLSKLEENQP